MIWRNTATRERETWDSLYWDDETDAQAVRVRHIYSKSLDLEGETCGRLATRMAAGRVDASAAHRELLKCGEAALLRRSE